MSASVGGALTGSCQSRVPWMRAKGESEYVFEL